jgi:hypothetical protein
MAELVMPMPYVGIYEMLKAADSAPLRRTVRCSWRR